MPTGWEAFAEGNVCTAKAGRQANEGGMAKAKLNWQGWCNEFESKRILWDENQPALYLDSR